MTGPVATNRWHLERDSARAYETYLVPAFFGAFADSLVAKAAPNPGERVLDVACGTGVVARRCADRVGADGRVVGLDASESMLETARSVSSEVAPHVEFVRGEVPSLPFDDASFDVITCQQALQFFDDRETALAEMRRVLTDDGRMALNVWRDLSCNPGYERLTEVLEREVGEDAAELTREPFIELDPEALRTLVSSAGFDVVRVLIDIQAVRFPTVSEFIRREAVSSELGDHLAELDEDSRKTLIDALQHALAPHIDDDGVVFPMQAFVALAHV